MSKTLAGAEKKKDIQAILPNWTENRILVPIPKVD